MTRTRDNAHRLAGTLWRHAQDPETIRRLAAALNYAEGQLQQDMNDISEYIDELESELEEARG